MHSPGPPGWHVANIGVHGGPATLHLEELWIKNVTITTGLVDTYSTPTLLRLLAAHQVDLARFVTHRFPMGDFLQAYDTFARRRRHASPQGGAHRLTIERAIRRLGEATDCSLDRGQRSMCMIRRPTRSPDGSSWARGTVPTTVKPRLS